MQDIVGFLNPVALGIHPFCSLRDRSAVSETADLVLYNFTADDSLSCKLVRETFDRGVFPDLRHLDPDASTTKSESNIIVTSPKQQPGLKVRRLRGFMKPMYRTLISFAGYSCFV